MERQNLRERRLVIYICEVTAQAVIPAHVALADLKAAMYDCDAETAFDEILEAWGEMSLGTTRVTDRVELALDLFPAKHVEPADYLNDRQLVALQIAKVTGRVASADLQARFDVSSECIRQDLTALCDRRLLEAQGETRGRYYIPNPGRNANRGG